MKAKNKVDAYNDIVTINNRDYNVTSNKDVLAMQQTLHNLGYNIPVTGRLPLYPYQKKKRLLYG